MNFKLEHFLHDLIWRIKEEYNERLDLAAAAKNGRERAIEDGQSWAYRHVLEMIENQLSAFGETSEMFSPIAPEAGNKAELKKVEF